MSKSNGTGVFVDIQDNGNHQMFGSTMALPDGFILPLFRGCTRVPMEEVNSMKVASGVETRDLKLRLAEEIVTLFWGKGRAVEAREEYVRQFTEREVPESAPTITFKDAETLLSVVAQHAAQSNADAKRKFSQGAVSLDGEKVTDVTYTLVKGQSYTLRVGRRVFTLQSA